MDEWGMTIKGLLFDKDGNERRDLRKKISVQKEFYLDDIEPVEHWWREMKGKHPAILEAPGDRGKEARKLFDEANELLRKIIAEKLLPGAWEKANPKTAQASPAPGSGACITVRSGRCRKDTGNAWDSRRRFCTAPRCSSWTNPRRDWTQISAWRFGA